MTAISHQDHDTKASGRLIILLAAMFLAPAVLAGFISQGLTVFLRMAGQPQEIVGLVFAAGIPFALSFLWAPLVDRYGFRRLGYRRGWLLISLVGAIAATSIFLVLDPAEHPYALILTAAVMMGFLGTYIAAASGWMLDQLGTSQHAAGAAAQASSAAIGGLILGLGIFYLFGDLGWQYCILALLGVTLLGLVLLVFLPRSPSCPPAHPERLAVFASLSLFRNRQAVLVYLFVQLMDMAITLPFAQRAILQVDAGMSLSEIGIIGVIGGNAAGLLGASIFGVVVSYIGAPRALAIIAFLALAMNVVLATQLGTTPSRTLVIAYVLGIGFLGFAGYTAGRSMFMGVCRDEHHAADFMTLMSLDAVGAMIAGALGAVIAGSVGASMVFAGAGGIAIVAIILSFTMPPRVAV